MKPFNLEEALKGKSVITRDGRPVNQLTLFKIGSHYLYPLVGVIEGMQDIHRWTADGTYCVKPEGERQVDLFML